MALVTKAASALGEEVLGDQPPGVSRWEVHTGMGDGPASGVVDRLFSGEAETFRREIFPGRAAVIHGPLARLQALFAPWCFGDVDELFAVESRRNQVVLPFPQGATRIMELPEPRSAVDFFRAGATVGLLDVHESLPGARQLLARLAAELKLPAEVLVMHAYGSPAGSGVPIHFDDREVLVVQLAGHKEWHVASSGVAGNRPRSGCMPGQGIPAHYSRSEVLESVRVFEEHHHVVRMAPGSVLFLPRGWWHRTVAGDAASISITIGIKIPSWSAVLGAALEHQLAARPEWQQLFAATGRGKQEFARLVRCLSDEMLEHEGQSFLDAFAGGVASAAVARGFPGKLNESLAPRSNMEPTEPGPRITPR
jgi:ribosomal protein L16 Arg81 hydroxylase